MPSEPKAHARAVVLVTAMSSVAPMPSIFDLELRVPAIRRSIANELPPLDLDAGVFRYRVDGNRIIAVRASAEDENGTRLMADAIHTEPHRHEPVSARRGSGSHRWWSAGADPGRRR